MLGEKLKALREAKGYVQRQIAAELQVDTAYISKIESNEKLVSRHHLPRLSAILNIPEDELTTYWIAEKLYELTRDEPQAKEAVTLLRKALNKNNTQTQTK